MNDTDILQHLLEIEGQAATLIDDAQAKADQRIKEAEEQNRLAFDEAYQKLATELEMEYQQSVSTIKSEYNQLLDQYRSDLAGMPRQNEDFSALAFSLLMENENTLNKVNEGELAKPLGSGLARFLS